MSEIYQLPDNNGNNNGGLGNIPFSIPIGGFGGGLFGNGGYGMNGIYDLLGVAIIASLFGWGNGGGFGSMPSTDYLKTKLDESDFEEVKDENKAQ